jgi:hypothetical protein
MEVEKDLLAPCGLYCGVCAMYLATRDNNEKFLKRLLTVYQGKLPGADEMTIEDLKCDGCLSGKPSSFCSVCAIKACNRQKGYAGCHECDDFPCVHIEDFPMPVGKKVILRAIPHRKAHGTIQWVKDEASRYICPECGHKLFRGAKRCNVCKVSVDLD